MFTKFCFLFVTVHGVKEFISQAQLQRIKYCGFGGRHYSQCFIIRLLISKTNSPFNLSSSAIFKICSAVPR